MFFVQLCNMMQQQYAWHGAAIAASAQHRVQQATPQHQLQQA
jgi:hypothetical protein